MITLHDYDLSADGYAVRLLLSILAIEYELVPVEYYPAREHEGDTFRALNPLASLPVLVDGDLVLTEVGGILGHLAARHDRSRRWLPLDDADALGRVMDGLGLAARLSVSAGLARLADAMMLPIDVAPARAEARRLLRVIDERLWFGETEGHSWLCPGPEPSIADLACFPHLALAEEGGIELAEYPAIRRWLDRVRRLPGFIVMPGVFGPD